MFVPINTDAPLYHFPWATICLIVVNTLCFLLTECALDEERLVPWMLKYGNGINPIQWLSAMFAHGGWFHLIGNMFFLWGFGLVVEGKLGFRRFLMLYLAVGLLQGALVDLLTLHRTDEYVLKHVLEVESRQELSRILAADSGLDDEEIDPELWDEIAGEWISLHKGRCLGASGAIFGILAVSLVWAPKNDMHVVGTIGFRPVSFEVSIMVYASFYLALNVLGVLLDRGAMDSSGLHLVGAIIGFGAGVLYLKKGWVDCENWDLFAVLSGKYGRFANENWALRSYAHTDKVYSEIPIPQDPETSKASAPKVGAASPRTSGTAGEVAPAERIHLNRKLQPICSMIDSGDFIGASDAIFELRLTDSSSRLDQYRLRKLAIGLLQAGAIDEAEGCFEEFLERFPEDCIWAKLRMAQLLLKERGRPSSSLKMVKTLKASELTQQQLLQAKKLLAVAKKQISDGVQDAEPEW